MPIYLTQLPFHAVRAFIVDGVPAGISRGGHAHRTTRQLMVLASGSVRIDLRREGEEISVMLDEARNAVLVGPAIWSRQTYLTADSRIVVFADEEYDPASYVSDEQK